MSIRAPPWRSSDAHNNPSALKLAWPPRPITMWSWTAMRKLRAASTTRRVMSISARDGVDYVLFLTMGPIRFDFRFPKPERPIPLTIGYHLHPRRLDVRLTLAEAGEGMAGLE